MTIMGCGGVLTVEDAKDKLEAGANLVQMISGMIFNGPHVVNDINMMFKRMN
jgi:dihydroorotate dehydrogenase